MTTPSTLQDIRNKVRRITARPSQNQLTDAEIDSNINTYAMYDLPEQLRTETFRTVYQFITQPNIGTYNFPVDMYIQSIPPVFCGGYQIVMSQNRELFYRMNLRQQFIETDLASGTGIVGPYNGTLSNVPLMRGIAKTLGSTEVSQINWMLMIYGRSSGVDSVVVDDGLGNLRYPYDLLTDPVRGTIDYVTGIFTVTAFDAAIDAGASITAQYVPYRASRPNSVLFFQDQLTFYPIPDQAYTISMEVFQKPTAMLAASQQPQLVDMWQLFAFGAADKIFCDNGDLDNLMKYRPLLEEQLKLVNRRTVGQYSTERASTIFSNEMYSALPFGNMFFGL
jgi:hypothetical protein